MIIMLKLYALSLRWLPADLRADFGPDMAQLFRDQMLATRGAVARFGLLMAAIVDVAAESARKRSAAGGSTNRGSLMSNFPNDFRHGLRLLRRYPATAVVAIATLALGIGMNVAIFSVVDAVLLRALPYADPNQLVVIYESRPRERVMDNAVAPADFVDWRSMSKSFSAMAGYAGGAVLLSGVGEPVQLPTGYVSSGFFDVLDIKPFMGRAFTPADEIDGAPRLAIITYGLWQRQFGADPNIIGRVVMMTGRPTAIAGVLPRSFTFFANVDVFSVLTIGPNASRGSHSIEVYARLKPGTTIGVAHKEMDQISASLEKEYPDTNDGHGANVAPLQPELVSGVRGGLLVLSTAVGFVLLLAAVNVANLMLVRGARRAREMSVRAALGADRWRLVTQSFAECLAVAAAGGALGVALAAALLRVLPLVLPEQLSVVRPENLHIDVRVLAAASALTLVTAFVFGLLPALQASRSDLVESLKQGGRSAAVISPRMRIALVISEVTLASLTLVGAGLIVRSFAAISSQPLGLDPHGRIVLELAAPAARYTTPDVRVQAMETLEQRLAAIPGVRSVGAIDILPLSGEDARRNVVIVNREPVKDSPTRMHPRSVTPSYFHATGMTILRGRGFDAGDRAGAPLVSVINEAAANRFWPGQDPIGKHWRYTQDDAKWSTIVGIAADVRHWGPRIPPNPMVFAPLEQQMSGAMTFVVDTPLSAAAFAPSAREAVHGFDPNIPVGNLQTFDDVVGTSLRAPRSITLLMSIFGALALFLAALGIYGVMSQLVASRAHEIGVRTALGARPGHIVAHFLAGCAWQTAIGVLVGGAAGAALIGSTPMLFGVKPTDPSTLAAVAATIFGASLAACLFPVARALRVDPIAALRR
jgi:putative ABC transport system permease protein